MIRTFDQRPLTALLATVLALSAAGLPAYALQPAATTNPKSRLDAAAEQAIKEQAGRHLLRVALMDLRASVPPKFNDYAFTAALLQIASDFDTEDATIARYRAEAAFNAGDAAGVMEASRAILKSDPSDTVALLRLITSRINQLQTVEERLAAFQNFLGPKGDSIDASVRSRLALDAALLCRERSDEEGFVRHIQQAAELDSTNKDAALLAYQHYSQHNDDAMGRMELLANLLYADPIDPSVHRMIRDELIAASAFDAARRFHMNAEKIAAFARDQPTTAEVVESMCIAWRSEGSQSMFDSINRNLMSDRDNAARELARLDPVLQQTARKPDDIRLTFDYEEIRLGAAIILENRAAIDASLRDLTATVADMLKDLADPEKRGPSVSEETAKEMAGAALAGLQIWRSMANRDLDKVEADLPKVHEYLPADNHVLQILEVWRAVRGNDVEAARALIAAGPDDAWIRLAEGTLEQQQGNAEKASAAFMLASGMLPLRVPGVLGWSFAEKSNPGVTAPNKVTTLLSEYVQTIPKWIDTMVDKPRMTQTLSVDLAPTEPEATQPSFATFAVRNISPIPLGMGSDRVVNSRLLFSPNLERKDGSSQVAEAEFVEINRRLRLLPGEMLSTRLWPEVGLTGLLSEVACIAPTRLRWRVIQGFETSVAASKTAGPGCQETNSGTVLRRPLIEAGLTPPQLIAAIASSSDDRWPVMLFAARAGMLGPLADRRLSSDNRAIVTAIAARYPTLSPELRLLTISILPPVALSSDTAPLDDALAAEQDTAVLAAIITTRCSKPDSPLLAQALASTDPRIARLAAIQKERLTEGNPTYATVGFGESALSNKP